MQGNKDIMFARKQGQTVHKKVIERESAYRQADTFNMGRRHNTRKITVLIKKGNSEHIVRALSEMGLFL